MGLLDKLSTGASAASSAVGAIGGISSLLFGASQQRKAARYQQKLQMELNEQQQRFARTNALTDYQRQRELIHDNAQLEKQGRQAAGLSTAGDFGSSSASVSPISAPSAGSAPSLPDPNASMLAGVSQIQTSANSLIQNRAAMANAESQELQNDITKKALTEKVYGAKGEGLKAGAEGKKAIALLPSDVQQGKDDAVIKSNERWKSENDSAYYSANAMSNANTLLSQSLAAHELYEKAKADKSMSAEQLQLFKDTYEFSVQAAKQNVENLRKQGAAIDASADASRASASASRAQASVLASEAEYNKRSMNYRVERARLDNIPKDIKEVLMRNNWVQRYVDDIEHGRKPSYEVKWHFDQIMLEHGLHSEKTGYGGIVDAIMR